MFALEDVVKSDGALKLRFGSGMVSHVERRAAPPWRRQWGQSRNLSRSRLSHLGEVSIEPVEKSWHLGIGRLFDDCGPQHPVVVQ